MRQRNKNVVFNCNHKGRRKLSVYVEILTRSVNMKLVTIVQPATCNTFRGKFRGKNSTEKLINNTVLYIWYNIE